MCLKNTDILETFLALIWYLEFQQKKKEERKNQNV